MAGNVSLWCGAVFAFVTLLAGCGFQRPTQTREAREEADSQWEEKGCGFTWDVPTPEGLQFSGVVYGCTVAEFTASVQVNGPTGDGHTVHMEVAAVMEGLPLAEAGEMVHYYAVEIPMAGVLDYKEADCRTQSTLRLLAKVDFEKNLATIQEAKSLEGRVICTRGGISVTSPQPGLADLPTPENLSLHVLDTQDCRQTLGGEEAFGVRMSVQTFA